MRVESLRLRNFRNIEDSSIRPDPTLNFLLGPNGQGKTSILEAISFLATLRSFRGAKSSEVIRFGNQAAEIDACLLPTESTEDWRTELKVRFQLADPRRQQVTKTALINGKPYRSSTQYLAHRYGSFKIGFHAISFNPSDHDLVRGDPAVRRAYLDRVIAAENIEYLEALQKYRRIIDQRNTLLRSSDRPSPDLLRSFSEPLISIGAWIVLKRLEWIQQLSSRLNAALHLFSPEDALLRIFYLSDWVDFIPGICIQRNALSAEYFTGHGPLPSLEVLKKKFEKKLTEVEIVEWKRRTSLVGPHRDDWAFFRGTQVLKGHGSQGEIRSALLALKFCEIELFRDATGYKPLFLLDDFSSELDQNRRLFLLRFLSETDLQVFVTTTDESLPSQGDGFRKYRRFRVLNGNLTEWA